MLKFILVSILICFLIVGLSDFMHYIWQILISPKKKPLRLYVVYLTGKDDYQVLYWLYEKIKWYGNSLCDKAVAVINETTDTELIERFSECGIAFLTKQELEEYGELNERTTVEGNG